MLQSQCPVVAAAARLLRPAAMVDFSAAGVAKNPAISVVEWL